MATPAEDIRTPPPTWMDKEFFQTALRSGEEDQSISVINIEMKMANAVGDNYSSEMYRVAVDFQRGSSKPEKRSLIVKCQPIGGKWEEASMESNVFPIEIDMLTQVLPEMYRILNEAAPGKFQRFGAKCLYHGLQPKKFIVIEDLAPLGYKLAKRWNGLDLEHSKTAMTTIAQFHAASIYLQDRDSKLLDKYIENIYNNRREVLGLFIDNAIRGVATAIKKLPELFDKSYSRRILDLAPSLYDGIVRANKCIEGGFNVLLHGDFWVNNMMFDNDEQVIFVDFQVPHLTSPAIDLLYFFTTSLSEDVYMNHQDELLEVYHSSLSDTLCLLGYGDKCILLPDLRKQMEDRGPHAVLAALLVLPIVRADVKDAFNIEKVLDDSGDNDEINFAMYSSPAYVSALRNMLPIFASKGWF